MPNILSKLLSAPVSRFIKSVLFPRDPQDVFISYESSFIRFFYAKQNDPEFSQAFKACKPTEFIEANGEHQIKTLLASTGQPAGISAISLSPDDEYLVSHQDLPGIGKTIVLFNGATDRYESSGSLKDMALLAKETGARVVGFNYSGIGKSATDCTNVRVNEFHDLVNNGIAVLNFLIREQGHPDNIIMLGDSFGSATAGKVQEIFTSFDIRIRLIASNTFSSFREVIHQTAKSNARILGWLFSTETVGDTLAQIGWDAELATRFKHFSPNNYVLQRHGDKTLGEATLKAHIQSSSIDYLDSETPEMSRLRSLLDRGELRLSSMHQHKLLSQLSVKRGSKYRVTEADIDTHPLPLHYFDGALERIVNYIAATNEYIADHPQSSADLNRLPAFLPSVHNLIHTP